MSTSQPLPYHVQRMVDRFEDGWYPELRCEAGWYGLLESLDKQLVLLAPEYTVQQIKEKFGMLRVYLETNSGDPAVRDTVQRILNRLETTSATVCEKCGKPGELYATKSRSPWVKTLCAECGKKLDIAGRSMIPQREWQAWWQEEKPAYDARQLASFCQETEGERILLLNDAATPVAFPHGQQITTVTDAAAAAEQPWDKVFLGNNERSEAFSTAFAARHQAYLDNPPQGKEFVLSNGTKGRHQPERPADAPDIWYFTDQQLPTEIRELWQQFNVYLRPTPDYLLAP